MYQGKHVNRVANGSTPRRKRRLRWRKEFVLLCSIVVLLIGLVGGSLAYLLTNTGPVRNIFTPANNEVDITESFDKEVKKNVKFQNKSDFPVYVRAKYVANWVNSDNQVYPGEPQFSVERLNTNDWSLRNNDGYYYYNKIVPANDWTSVFIYELQNNDSATPDGYHLEVNVIVETIQATPADAVKDAWGFVPTTLG